MNVLRIIKAAWPGLFLVLFCAALVGAGFLAGVVVMEARQ